MADGFFFRNPQNLLTLALTVCIFAPGICQSGCLPTDATLGERLVLDCSVFCSGLDNDFEWSTGDEVLERNYTHLYTVTENVTIREFGGKTYSCRCQNNDMTTCFYICVQPNVSLTFTSNPVIFNSSVNVTCTAVSYPRANVSTDYAIQHPKGVSLTPKHIAPDLDGVIEEIDHANDTDDGEYHCHVTITCMGTSMMGETVKSLTVKNNTNDTCTNTTMPTTAPTDDTPTTAPTDDTPTTLLPSDSGSATSSFSNFIIMMGITLYVVITSVQV